MIHYHGAPVSGPAQEARAFYKGRHIMVSFANPACLTIVADVCASFVLDNGAFTTWKQGKEFDKNAYYKWVDEWRQHPAFHWAIIPDKIDGTERENMELIGSWPFKHEQGVLVWHFHERPSKLYSFINWWPVVALGSSGQWATPGTPDWWKRLDSVMPRIVNEKGQCWGKLHGLRMLDRDIFTKFPFHSADSCNAAINAGSVKRFGMYCPLSAAQRANVIADIIESEQSAPSWKPRTVPLSIFDFAELS